MTLNLAIPEQEDLSPRITVFGVGGAGGNAVNNMIDKRLGGVEFVVANTDAQALAQSNATSRVQMGVKVTEGLGAGARPSVGAAAAEETIESIVDHLSGAHMCFITGGMGGGTGTGAAPIIAQAARELGVLTVGVITKPFQFEGSKRMRQAEEGVETLQQVVDTLIIIPNQNLFRLANENTTFTEAFSLADDVLYQGVKGVTDLMVRPGLINLDFADVRAVMDEMGKAMMGTGEAEGAERAVQAAEKAIANPLLDEISLKGAKGVLINITGGHDLTLFELDEAANRIRQEVDPDANIIVGSTLDTEMEGAMRLSVVATGIDATVEGQDAPVQRRSLAEPLRPQAEVEEDVVQSPAAPSEPELPPQAAEAAPLDPASAMDVTPPYPQQGGERAMQDDGLPPPSYRPAEPEPSAPAAPQGTDTDAAAFVAPKRPAPGTPTPEAVARLRAVVGDAAERQHREPAPARAPAPRQAPDPRPAPEDTAQQDRTRFGINSLINRMTGQGAESGEPARGAPPVRRQPPLHGGVAGTTAPQAEDDQDRIEVPAFLRRQAN